MTSIVPTSHEHTWEYLINGAPVLDVQGDPRTQPPQRFSRLTGVDGRYKGKLRRFPGWTRLHGITLTDPSSSQTVTLDALNGHKFFQPFAIQKGVGGSNVIRGILFLGKDDSNDKLYAFFSDDDGSSPTAPALGIVHSFSTRVSFVHATIDHQLVYIVGEDTATPAVKIEVLARYTGTTNGWKSAAWDAQPPTEPTATERPGRDATAGAWHPGFLETSSTDQGYEYGISYRLIYPDQGFVGPLSKPGVFKTGIIGNNFLKAYFDLSGITVPPGYGDIFSRCVVQVFRTVFTAFETVDARGQLFLEAEFEVVRQTGSLTITSIDQNIDYSKSLKRIHQFVAIDSAISVGDTIYITWRVTSAGIFGIFDIDATMFMVYKRQIVDLVAISRHVFIDEQIKGNTTSGLFTDATYHVSHVGDGDDTTGTFIVPALSISAGWHPSLGGIIGVRDAVTGLDDRALATQPSLDTDEFATFSVGGNPRARFIEEYEGLFVYVTSPSNKGNSGNVDVLRWSFVDRPRKGLLNLFNRKTLSDLTDKVIGVINTKTFLVIILNNSLIRIHRSGSRLVVDTIQNQYGTVSDQGFVAVGNNLYFTSPVGLLIADLTTGQLNVVNAVQHFFGETGRWRDDLVLVQAAYDVQLGALLFLNPTKFELLIVWLNHGQLGHLIDVPFDRVVSSGDLQTGGLRRAIFYNQTGGSFHEIDADRSSPSRTTFSYSGEGSLTYNSISTGGTTSQIIDAGATFHANMLGHFVRVKQTGTPGTWLRARITAVDVGAKTLTLDTAVGGSPLQYEVGGIPLQATMWPLSINPDLPMLDLFHMKKVNIMGAAIVEIGPSGRSISATLDKLRYQLFERDMDTAAVEVDGTLDADFNRNTFTAINRAHSVLVPGFEQWSSNLDMDLLGLLISGTIGTSVKDKA